MGKGIETGVVGEQESVAVVGLEGEGECGVVLNDGEAGTEGMLLVIVEGEGDGEGGEGFVVAQNVESCGDGACGNGVGGAKGEGEV